MVQNEQRKLWITITNRETGEIIRSAWTSKPYPSLKALVTEIGDKLRKQDCYPSERLQGTSQVVMEYRGLTIVIRDPTAFMHENGTALAVIKNYIQTETA